MPLLEALDRVALHTGGIPLRQEPGNNTSLYLCLKAQRGAPPWRGEQSGTIIRQRWPSAMRFDLRAFAQADTSHARDGPRGRGRGSRGSRGKRGTILVGTGSVLEDG